jgi:hypothetical protein
MAEFAASIIAIVSAGTKVTLVLSKVGSELGSAGKEARMIASEIRSFCSVLKTLEKSIGQVQTSAYYAQCKDIVADMTLASTEMFADVLDAAESVQKMTTGATKGASGKDDSMSVRQRVNWVLFKKPKIVLLRASIESYKSTMVLLLGTIHISERCAKRMSMIPTEAALKEEDEDNIELQSLQSAQRDSLIELEAAKKRLSDIPDEHAITEHVPELTDSSTKQGDGGHQSLRAEIESLRNNVASFDMTSGTMAIADRAETHNKRATVLLDAEHNRLSRSMSLRTSVWIQDSASTLEQRVRAAVESSKSQDPTLSEIVQLSDDPNFGYHTKECLQALHDKDLREELLAICQWFHVLASPERVATLCALLQDAGPDSILLLNRYVSYLAAGIETDISVATRLVGLRRFKAPLRL